MTLKARVIPCLDVKNGLPAHAQRLCREAGQIQGFGATPVGAIEC